MLIQPYNKRGLGFVASGTDKRGNDYSFADLSAAGAIGKALAYITRPRLVISKLELEDDTDPVDQEMTTEEVAKASK